VGTGTVEPTVGADSSSGWAKRGFGAGKAFRDCAECRSGWAEKSDRGARGTFGGGTGWSFGCAASDGIGLVRSGWTAVGDVECSPRWAIIDDVRDSEGAVLKGPISRRAPAVTGWRDGVSLGGWSVVALVGSTVWIEAPAVTGCREGVDNS